MSTTSGTLAPTPILADVDGLVDDAVIEVAPAQRPRCTTVALWCLRALMLVPVVLMGPEFVAAITRQPDAVTNLSKSTADVLGTSAFLAFVLMLTVTPLQVVTGWRWHVALRRDFGLGMFIMATVDLILAALTTGDTFKGGFFDRVGGHTFLFVGTLSTLLVVPLALTANHRAQRLLGHNWRRLHRITYVVWGLILVHLLLLFGLRDLFVDALLLSAPLVVLRLPPVRRRWVRARRAKTHSLVRVLCAIALITVFTIGIVPFVQELALKGTAAFHQQPID